MKQDKELKEDNRTNDELLREIVIARLEQLPDNVKISIG